jgi:hypothetical protein
MSSPSPIAIVNDARFKLARTLLNSEDDDGPESAIKIFATLHELCVQKHGEKSLDATLCQYEYGNALFRAVVRNTPLEEEKGGGHDDGDKKPAAKPASAPTNKQREVMDAAVEKRSHVTDDTNGTSNKRAKVNTEISEDKATLIADTKQSAGTQQDNHSDNSIDEDIHLGLEMMTGAFNTFYEHAEDIIEHESKQNMSNEQKYFALSQLPRILTCIGDVHSFLGQHGDAAESYSRALPYREEAWKLMKERHGSKSGDGKGKTGSFSVEQLQCQRRLIELCALLTEELLACPDGEDVVCQGDDEEEIKVLVKAKDRMSFAQSWYEMAREELDDISTSWMCLCARVFFCCVLSDMPLLLLNSNQSIAWVK